MGIPEKRLQSKDRGGFGVKFTTLDDAGSVVSITSACLLHITGGCDTEPVALVRVTCGPDKDRLRSVLISRLVID